MNILDPRQAIVARGRGQDIHRLMTELFPICRSITGDGFRRTLEIIRRHVPVEVREVPSGTRVFDWTVPKEWNIKEAYIKGPTGEKVVDFRDSNLHVVSYSVPVRTILPLEDLKGHLHTLPDHPDWIPYRTSYYEENWGFCLSHRQFLGLAEGRYEVVIDASLEDGSLSFGEYYLKGRSDEEILISAHACHPSLANDNLSGVGLASILARDLTAAPRRYSYRFLFIPGTIGAITWLCLNEGRVGKIKSGLVLTGVGDPGAMVYKKTRRGDSEVDRAAAHVLRHSDRPSRLLDFRPDGYDERQYGSLGFNLPVGRLSRTPGGEYPEYHTSADNLDFVSAEALGASYETALNILDILEGNVFCTNMNPKCEPQLGRRGLYSSAADNLAALWVLNRSDGRTDLLDIADGAGLPFPVIREAARKLIHAGLLSQGAGGGGMSGS